VRWAHPLASRNGWTPFVAILLWTLSFPLVWQLATAGAVGLRRPATEASQFAHSLLFLAGSIVFLAPRWSAVPADRLRGYMVHVHNAAVPLALCAFLLHREILRYPTVFSLIVLGAAVEEVVFRVLLPARCSAILASRFTGGWTRLAGLVAAQAVFAASHGVVGLFTAAPAPPALELARLAGSGLLLQTIQVLFGVGAAIAAHAVVNTALVLGTYLPSPPPGWATLAPSLAGGLLLLWAAAHHSRGVSAPRISLHPKK
jgi:hypothetical protein